MEANVTIPALQQMKRDGRKIVGLVAWDCQMAQIADRAGVEIVSVGDSVGVNLWGRSDPFEVSMDEMVVVCKAVRRGVKRALVSCDVPFGPLQAGAEAAESRVRLAVIFLTFLSSEQSRRSKIKMVCTEELLRFHQRNL